MTFAEKVIKFNKNLKFQGSLPEGIEVMNPFQENKQALEISSEFYRKFFDDKKQRKFILGINAGRHGAGVTGIPFTDTKRLEEDCGLEFKGVSTHEPSSVFVYDMINDYGGVEKFYTDFYINSVCPLGFVKKSGKKETNFNYYDSKELQEAVLPFIKETIQKQIDLGLETETVFCLGTGKNYDFLKKLNVEGKFFEKIVPLEHPRYIIQYKSKNIHHYKQKYINALKEHLYLKE